MADYTYWENALQGRFGPVHESEPQVGFWRKRTSKKGTFVPVAIWQEGDALVALVDGKPADSIEIWTFACRHPVTEEQYHARVESGRWHDEDESTVASLMIGGNNPPTDETDILRDQIDTARAGLPEYAEINDDDTAAKAQSLRARLNELAGEADKKRESEKRPHLEAGKAIDARWRPLVEAAKEAANALRASISRHETRKFKEAEKARLKAEEVRLKAKTGADQKTVQPLPEPVPITATKIAGAYGRAATVKVVKIAMVRDIDQAFAFLKTHKELIELIGKLAQRAVDAGYTVPGVEVSEERKVI